MQTASNVAHAVKQAFQISSSADQLGGSLHANSNSTDLNAVVLDVQMAAGRFSQSDHVGLLLDLVTDASRLGCDL